MVTHSYLSEARTGGGAEEAEEVNYACLSHWGVFITYRSIKHAGTLLVSPLEELVCRFVFRLVTRPCELIRAIRFGEGLRVTPGWIDPVEGAYMCGYWI